MIKKTVGLVFPKNDKKYIYVSEMLLKHQIPFKQIDVDATLENQPTDLDCVLMHPKDHKCLPDLFKANPNLKWVMGHLAGVDPFIQHKQLFHERNAVLTNVKGVFSPSLGEWVLGAIMYWEKNLHIFHELKKEKSWKIAPVNMLKDKTLGIVGYGDIGIAIAQRASVGLGMRCIGLKNRLNITKGSEYVSELVDNSKIDYVLSQSDYVVSILPATKSTENFFDDEKFSKMKKGSIFLNIGRGNSVNEEHLFNHLKSRTNIKAACLDVTKVEPLPVDSPLWTLDNVLISNHSADQLNDNLDNQKMSLDLFEKMLLEEFLKYGEVKSNLIDFEVGY